MIEALDDGRVESFEENAEHHMHEETSRITGYYSQQSSQQSVRRDDINGIRESILFIEVVNVCCPQRSGEMHESPSFILIILILSMRASFTRLDARTHFPEVQIIRNLMTITIE